jgi:hypothetical protein
MNRVTNVVQNGPDIVPADLVILFSMLQDQGCGRLRVTPNVALPNAEYSPPCTFGNFNCTQVLLAIILNFLLPKPRVRSPKFDRSVSGASVPQAPVHENSEAITREYKVWGAATSEAYMQSIAQPKLMDSLPKSKFWTSVNRPASSKVSTARCRYPTGTWRCHSSLGSRSPNGPMRFAYGSSSGA